jgi:hypothetical protein
MTEEQVTEISKVAHAAISALGSGDVSQDAVTESVLFNLETHYTGTPATPEQLHCHVQAHTPDLRPYGELSSVDRLKYFILAAIVKAFCDAQGGEPVLTPAQQEMTDWGKEAEKTAAEAHLAALQAEPLAFQAPVNDSPFVEDLPPVVVETDEERKAAEYAKWQAEQRAKNL